jgi:hypothetical protein
VPELPDDDELRALAMFLRLNVSCSGAFEACGGGTGGGGFGMSGPPNPHIMKLLFVMCRFYG